MNISIKHRIYWSFTLLVLLFVINGIVTILTIRSNKKLAVDIFRVMNPSIQALDDFKKMMLESKMYTVNWVFLKYDQEDKRLLRQLHDSGYALLKSRVSADYSLWADKARLDSLHTIYTGFEELLAIEKNIMGSLRLFTDYDDPVIKREAERKVEAEILPRTAALRNSLNIIYANAINIRSEKGTTLERSASKLRMLIVVLAIIFIFSGFVFSAYMTKAIIRPLNSIRQITDKLGLGIIEKSDHHHSRNEIGKMIGSVNTLSERLQATATFAQQVGLKNFDTFFYSLSEEDTLGKALIAMRDNIKSSDEKINQVQHIAHLGSLEKDVATGKVFLSDEMFSILDIDPAAFDYNFQNILNLILPEYRDSFNAYREKYLQGASPGDFECKILTAKGRTKNVVVQSKLMLDAKGKVNRIVGIIQDVTERKKIEEQIKLSNERFELVIKTTNDMIWDWDLVNNTIFRNENHSKVFGPDAGDRNDVRRWIKNIHPDDKEWVEEYIRQKLIDPYAESWEVEFRYYRHDNEMVYLHDRAYVIRNENKKAIRMVGATSDITERKKAEEALIESEQYNRNLFNQSPVGLALSRMDGTLEDVNETYAKITGHTIEECKTMSYYEITPDKYSRQEINILKELELTGRYGPYEKEYIHKDGHLVPVTLSGTILEKNGIKYTWSSVEDISQRKIVDSKLRKSEERYRQIVETAQEGIWLVDENYRTIFANKIMGEMLGYAPAEMMGKDIYYFMDKETKKTAFESLGKRKQGIKENFDFKHITKKGEVVWTFMATSPVIDDNGKYIGALAMVTDITERKRTEEALSNNELRYRTLTGSAPVGIFQTDIEGKTIYVNETWLEYTGMTFEETLGDGWISAIHPVDRETMIKDWNDKSEKGLESATEYRLIDKKGNVKWVMGKAVPIFNKSGKILGHIGTVSDITERKQAIELLEQSENKYRQIVETAQEGIWLIDENNYISFFNQKMCEILGYSAEEMKGKKLFDFMDADGKKNALPQIEKRKQKINGNYDVKYITKSGKPIWTNISTNTLFGEDGKYKGALAMVTDITHRKSDEELLHQSEIKLAAKNKELEQKNKELEQFAYVASHDLQEPLRTTSSFVNLLEEQYKGRLDEKADKYIHYIVESSDRMKTLITDLLEFSRIGSKKELKEFDCNAVLQEVLDDLGAAIKETGAKITSETLPVISGYPEIRQLFQNLLFNSIKFRKKNTRPEIHISVQYKTDEWQFAFSDNGIGIAKENHERIFIIFQRLHTRTEYPGSGIGLSHCKKIVELHRGKIWLESEPGKGATFYFTIPQKKYT
jgi:PAS domain S-box-containing protein